MLEAVCKNTLLVIMRIKGLAVYKTAYKTKCGSGTKLGFHQETRAQSVAFAPISGVIWDRSCNLCVPFTLAFVKYLLTDSRLGGSVRDLDRELLVDRVPCLLEPPRGNRREAASQGGLES